MAITLNNFSKLMCLLYSTSEIWNLELEFILFTYRWVNGGTRVSGRDMLLYRGSWIFDKW